MMEPPHHAKGCHSRKGPQYPCDCYLIERTRRWKVSRRDELTRRLATEALTEELLKKVLSHLLVVLT